MSDSKPEGCRSLEVDRGEKMKAEARKIGEVLGWMRVYLQGSHRLVFLLVLASVLVGLSSVIDLQILRYFIDRIADTRDITLFWKAFAVYCVGILIHGAGVYLHVVVTASLMARLFRKIKLDLFTKYQELSIDFLVGNRSGELVNRMSSETGALQGGFWAFSNFLKDVLMALAYAITAAQMSPKYTLVALVVVPIIAIAIHRAYAGISHLSGEIQARNAEINNALLQNLRLARMVRIFRMEKSEISRFDLVNAQALAGMVGIQRKNASVALGFIYMNFMGTGLIFVMCAREVVEGRLSIGAFIGFVGAVSAIYHPVSRIFEHISKMLEVHGTGQRLFETLGLTPSVADTGTRSIDGPIREIRFEDVGFQYPATDKWVLSNVNFQVATGETVAIVGKNGEGKSTLLNLIPRFFSPGRGRILVDGVDIASYRLSDLRQAIAMVGQEIGIFDGTIRENILIGRPGASEIEMLAAANAAFADEFIRKLPKGYDTPAGEGGGMLSGGQKQRIAIARAFLKNAPILVLDEPTSALDTASREAVLIALKNLIKDRIVFIVTHQPEALGEEIRILRLESGSISEIKDDGHTPS